MIRGKLQAAFDCCGLGTLITSMHNIHNSSPKFKMARNFI